jgi:broad specificity phosphatase PhoE
MQVCPGDSGARYHSFTIFDHLPNGTVTLRIRSNSSLRTATGAARKSWRVMPLQLAFVSHASTAAVRETAFPADEPLDESGIAKAAHVGARLRRGGKNWVAPELRALQTAEQLQLAATIDPALRECDHGRWRGRSVAAIQQAEGDALLAWMQDPAAAPHGGETLLHLLGRAAAWLDARAIEEEGHGIVVTHASIVRASIIHAIGATPLSFWRIDVAPLSCTILSFNRQWRLRSLDRFR